VLRNQLINLVMPRDRKIQSTEKLGKLGSSYN